MPADQFLDRQSNKAVGMSGSIGILPGGYFARLLEGKEPMSVPTHCQSCGKRSELVRFGLSWLCAKCIGGL